MTPIGKLVDIFCFLILALIIGASCLILLPTIKIQSDFSISAILVLNVYCERSVKGILHPSCLHSMLLIFKSSDSFLNKKSVSKSHKSPDKNATSSELKSLKSCDTCCNASDHSTLSSLPLCLIYGSSKRCVSKPSQAYRVLSEIHSSLISSFSLGSTLFTFQP